MIKVILMAALTVDGKIARQQTEFANWTSPEDKKLFVEVSKRCGVVVMGENTFKTFPAPLPNRLNVVFTENTDQKVGDNVKLVQGELKPVLEELSSLGYQEVVLGGGSFLYSSFLENKLVNEMILTIEPKIFGAGLSLFDRTLACDLKLLEHRLLNENSLMLRYQVNYPSS